MSAKKVKVTRALLKSVEQLSLNAAFVVKHFFSQREYIKELIAKLEAEEKVTRDQQREIHHLNQRIRSIK